MEEVRALLASTDRAERLEGLARLGDVLEYGSGDATSWQRTLQSLVDGLSGEPDPEITEAALNTLLIGAVHANLAYDLAPLVSALPTLPPVLVPYALELVGYTRDETHAALLERYAASDDPEVAEAAREALVELKGDRHVH